VAEFARVLVTGGAGFIGANYVRPYAGNLDNLEGLMDRITFVRGDVARPEDVDKAMAGAEAVVHFAAESHVDRSLLDSRPFVRTNVEGTMVLLDAARRHGV